VVADDDPTVATLVLKTMESHGLECAIALDGTKALELIRDGRPDAVVLDVNMPDRDGYDVLSALRADPALKDTKVLLLTARRREADILRGFGLGADDYIVKPFSPMELVARIGRLLRSAA
jgi:DNA-binding response OmpR family regulator